MGILTDTDKDCADADWAAEACRVGDRKRYQGCFPGTGPAMASAAVAISSARSSKRIGQVCGVAQFRGRVIEPRQVLPAATRVSFRTSVVSGVNERFAEVTSQVTQPPQPGVDRIQLRCSGYCRRSKSAQLPPTRRLMCASPLAAIGGAGKPAVPAISSNRCTSASPQPPENIQNAKTGHAQSRQPAFQSNIEGAYVYVRHDRRDAPVLPTLRCDTEG